MVFTKEDSAKTKGIAVVLLLFHHLFFTDRGYEVNLQLVSQDTLRALAVGARICVWIFAFLSAYGVAVQFEHRAKNETVSDFLKRRWISLMKGYWFVFLLVFFGMLFAGKHPMEKYDNSVLNMLLDAFALSDFFGTPTMLGTWWYMCFAQMQLLLLPAVILLCKHLGGIASFSIVFFFSQCVSNTIVSASGGDYMMYTYATLFGVLCVQYRFFEGIKVLSGCKAVLRWLVVLGIAVLGIWMRSIVARECQINRVSFGVAAVCIAVLVFLMKEKILNTTIASPQKSARNNFL